MELDRNVKFSFLPELPLFLLSSHFKPHILILAELISLAPLLEFSSQHLN